VLDLISPLCGLVSFQGSNCLPVFVKACSVSAVTFFLWPRPTLGDLVARIIAISRTFPSRDFHHFSNTCLRGRHLFTLTLSIGALSFEIRPE